MAWSVDLPAGSKPWRPGDSKNHVCPYCSGSPKLSASVTSPTSPVARPHTSPCSPAPATSICPRCGRPSTRSSSLPIARPHPSDIFALASTAPGRLGTPPRTTGKHSGNCCLNSSVTRSSPQPKPKTTPGERLRRCCRRFIRRHSSSSPTRQARPICCGGSRNVESSPPRSPETFTPSVCLLAADRGASRLGTLGCCRHGRQPGPRTGRAASGQCGHADRRHPGRTAVWGRLYSGAPRGRRDGVAPVGRGP